MEEVVQIELTSRRTRSAVGAKNLARATRIGDVLGTRSWRAGELGVGGVVVVGSGDAVQEVPIHALTLISDCWWLAKRGWMPFGEVEWKWQTEPFL
jgi:hypothetical protein